MASIIFNVVSSQNMPPNCIAKLLTYLAPLSGATTNSLDLTNQALQNHIGQMQSVYIENGLNAQSVSITCQVTQHKVTCPARSQGWFPLLVVPGAEQFDIASTGGVDIRFSFLNVPMPSNVWAV